MDNHQVHLFIANAELLQRTTTILNQHQPSAAQHIHQSLEQFATVHKSRGRMKQILCTDNSQLPTALRARGLFIPVVLFDSNTIQPSNLSCVLAGETDESIAEAFVSVFRIANQLEKLKRSAQKLATLAERERRIISLAAEGIPNKAIATQLGVSIKTVEKNRRNAYHKLSVSSTAEMASLVTFNRYFDPNLGGNPSVLGNF